MAERNVNRENEWARDAWNQNADFWDNFMGEGNDFVTVLEWPPSARMLALKPGERVLDIACGNGLTSRRLADLGAEVVAADFSEAMLRYARERSATYGDRIDYRMVDVTEESALLGLGEGSFDAALCNMALFDIADIDPLLRATFRLLRSGGRFVFSVLHPAFNGPHTLLVAEEEETAEAMITRYMVKVRAYLTPVTYGGRAVRTQPSGQPIFHRPLQSLLGACFQAGFVLDDMAEMAFPKDYPERPRPLAWGPTFSEIPPILVARLRKLPV
jgi:2-polyprenyl-3-methyl-5-hydroxy-6-metoxy-1,4-benzoquinol methylase